MKPTPSGPAAAAAGRTRAGVVPATRPAPSSLVNVLRFMIFFSPSMDSSKLTGTVERLTQAGRRVQANPRPVARDDDQDGDRRQIGQRRHERRWHGEPHALHVEGKIHDPAE